MKKIVNAALLSGCILSAAAHAQDIVDYAGAGLAIQNASDLDMGLALVANAGKNIDTVHENFFVEGETTFSLLAPSTSETVFGTDIDSTVRFFTLGVYAAYVHPINSEINVRGRAGLLYENASAEVCVGSTCADDSDGEFQVSFGVGGDYELNSDMAVTADFTFMEADLLHIGVGAKFKF